MNRQSWIALVSGLLFALGLGASGMTQPGKVIGFLDVFGAWDPSLALVMIGAIAVHVVFARRALGHAARPLFAERFLLPTASRVDGRLVAGSALFGLGWGTAGFCPGPAVVSLVTFSPKTLLFVASMLVGMLVYAVAFERPAARAETRQEPRRGSHRLLQFSAARRASR